jgi:hypothetical protein
MSNAIIGTGILIQAGTGSATSATSAIGAGANGVVTTTVTATGEDGNLYTIEVVEGVGNNLALAAALDGYDITVTLGTDGSGDPDDTKNTATLIAAAIDALAGVTAAASGSGVTPISAAVAQQSFHGGSMTGGTWTTLAEIVSLKPPAFSRNEIDVSNHNGGIEEKLLGMLRQGQVTGKCNWLPTDATQVNTGNGLLADVLANVKRSWRITYPPSGLPTWAFAARCQLFELPEVTTDAAMQVDFALTIDSAIDMVNS